MLAFVQNKEGLPLMPCNPAKARCLLKEGMGKVVKRTPFTIQLLFGSSGYRQDITLGIDSGYKSIGVSAVSGKKELFSAEVKLRTDIVKLNSERKHYRRARRNRNTWYRQPRFLNRKKPEGWLAPSIQNKLDTHVRVINQVKEILPVTKVVIEVAAFDIQKIKNPEVEGPGYQQGEQHGFWNTREYVLYRDRHKCQHCKGKSKDPVLEVHHIISRQTGGDRPDNLITLCSSCHEKVSQGKLELKVKPSQGFKAETFMSIVRRKLVDQIRNIGSEVTHTYGYLTKAGRTELGLPKSHINDAFVVAGGNGQKRFATQYIIRQVRKCNRKLFKGDRSHIRNTAPREVFGFRQWDKVLHQGHELFIKGRRLRGFFALSDIEGKLIKETSYKHLTLLERATSYLIERRPVLLPALNDRVPTPERL